MNHVKKAFGVKCGGVYFCTEYDDYTELWFKNTLNNSSDPCPSPCLDYATVNFIKATSIFFRLNVDVFCLTVELLQRYVQEKRRNGETLGPAAIPLLLSALFICDKQLAVTNLKISTLVQFVKDMNDCQITSDDFVAYEEDILTTLNFNVPLNTHYDNMLLLLVQFMRPNSFMKRPLYDTCVNILQLFYFNQKSIFRDLSKIYGGSNKSKSIFDALWRNKLFVSAAVLLCGVRDMHRSNADGVNVAVQLGLVIGIHYEHIDYLAKLLEREIRKSQISYQP